MIQIDAEVVSQSSRRELGGAYKYDFMVSAF